MINVEQLMEDRTIKVLIELLKLSNTDAYEHSCSVARITSKMLEKTNFDEETKKEIVTGALLHDIGKAFIPFNLTMYPNSLTMQQYDIVKIHTTLSYEVVKSVFSEIVQNICLLHHEKPDGSGYMAHMRLIAIPDYVLLVEVADVYDALIGHRSYKTQYTKEQVVTILKKDAQNMKLDDEYVNLLLGLLSEEEC